MSDPERRVRKSEGPSADGRRSTTVEAVNEPARPARLKDVAELAGVSLKTVTNVVHERRYVKDETRARVKAAIEQLGYTPSQAARQLQSGRSNTVALAVPRIDEPYLGALAHAVISAGSRRGYTVIVDETGVTDDHEELAARGYPGHAIDGVIYSPLAIDPQRMAELTRYTPMVLLGEHLSAGTADYVAIDNEASAREVVQHLAAGGRTRIAYLGKTPRSPTGVGQLRFDGYRSEAAALGLELRDHWVLSCNRLTRESGIDGARQILPWVTEIDAVICASDLLAVGLIRTLTESGLTVPDDIAVVGWDNIVDGAFLTPTLSTVAPDLETLADKTFEALIARISGSREPAQVHIVPHQLIVRESSGPAKPA
jgi:LacI family repressor for deo operon, udp, cdd, tsx, nupC, and nupG